jgi:hypothetical protein
MSRIHFIINASTIKIAISPPIDLLRNWVKNAGSMNHKYGSVNVEGKIDAAVIFVAERFNFLIPGSTITHPITAADSTRTVVQSAFRNNSSYSEFIASGSFYILSLSIKIA